MNGQAHCHGASAAFKILLLWVLTMHFIMDMSQHF